MIKTTTNTVLDYSYVSKRMIDIDSRTFKAISDFTNCLHNLCLEYNRNAVVYNIMSSLELLIVLMESQFEGLKNIHYIRLCACDGKIYNIKVSDIRWVGHGAMESLILFLNGLLMKMKLYIVLIMDSILTYLLQKKITLF